MPCKHACVIIDTIYINIYNNNFIFILFKKGKGLRNGHNYLFIGELIKRNLDERCGKQTYEIGSLIFWHQPKYKILELSKISILENTYQSLI